MMHLLHDASDISVLMAEHRPPHAPPAPPHNRIDISVNKRVHPDF